MKSKIINQLTMPHQLCFFVKSKLKALLLILCLIITIQQSYAQADITLNTPITTAQSITATHSITLNNGFSADGANGKVSLQISGPPVQNCVPLAATPSANQNYISTITPRIPISDTSALRGRNTCEVMQAIQYIDGLGRPLQTVQVKGNSDATRDVVQPVAYDQYGREAIKYLPYTDGAATPGSYRGMALGDALGVYTNSAQYSFYHQPQANVNYLPINIPSASTAFEASPLNRVVEQGSPGADWQLGGHTNRIIYATNDGASYWAKQFAVSIDANGIGTLIDQGSYGTNQLYVTVSQNENWLQTQNIDIRLNTTEEYKDKEGHVVLKRTYNMNGSTFETLSTYYVYDDFGNLSFVLPPKAEADGGLNSTSNQTALDNLCYQYRYDDKARLVEKRIPGSGWQYSVYNVLDEVVATQDSNQRAQNLWVITKYDALGRTVVTGIWNNDNASMGRTTLQASVYAQTAQWENKDNAQTYGYTLTNTYPTTLNTILSVSYYDDYNIPNLPAAYTQTGNSQMTKGLATASLTNVLGTSDMLWSVNYYDDKGRSTNTYKQHYLGGTANLNTANYDHVANTYDFTNAVTNTTRQHYTNSSGTPVLAVTVADSLVYDHMGRKRQTWEQINGGTNVLLSQNDYNEVGQALAKHLHSENSGASYLQTVTYAYNERGWMINESSSKFTLNLAYNTNITTGATPQYNGNIAEMYTTSDHTAANSKMKYSYDALNRLIAADHTNGLLTENGISYDKMGNIMGLSRTGANAANLSYTYSGNQLTTVTNGSSAFRSYAYDGNGNATTDGGSKAINYNMLNLPQSVTQSGTTLAIYTYEASGTKIRNTGSDGTWDYVSGIVYHNNTIDFISTEEGRAIPNGTSYSYQYNLKDHLGNDRVSMDKNGVLQEDEYYAFGLRNAKYDNSNNNRYLYNGKEIQTDLANQYDYGARFYDPVIARWTSVDPLAEYMRKWSPYSYAFDNPIRYIDKDGLIPFPMVKFFKGMVRRIDSWFGPRNTGIPGASTYHKGLDMNYGSGDQDFGAPIQATHDGVVSIHDNPNGKGGRYVTVTSPDKSFRTQYLHLSKILVKDGQVVKEGEEVGELGGSGYGMDRSKKVQVHQHYQIQKLNKKTGSYDPYDPTEGKIHNESNVVDPQKWITGEGGDNPVSPNFVPNLNPFKPNPDNPYKLPGGILPSPGPADKPFDPNKKSNI